SSRLTFDGRTFTDSLKGRFTSRRRAKGRYKLRISGCVGVMAAKFRLKKPRPPRPPGGGGGGGGGGNPCGTPVYDPNAPNATGGTGGINYCPGLYRY
ncbi:MAG: hypothetical protein H0V85_06600, partial [Thermoleophilaceae bacterium]|nr:hypothetical protein [Thermoleophilaceae bacterium]